MLLREAVVAVTQKEREGLPRCLQFHQLFVAANMWLLAWKVADMLRYYDMEVLVWGQLLSIHILNTHATYLQQVAKLSSPPLKL